MLGFRKQIAVNRKIVKFCQVKPAVVNSTDKAHWTTTGSLVPASGLHASIHHVLHRATMPSVALSNGAKGTHLCIVLSQGILGDILTTVSTKE